MERDLPIRLGKRMRALREAGGLTQEQLSHLMLKSVETISNFERGETTPSVHTLARFADRLGIALEEVLAFDRPTAAKASSDPWARARFLSASDQKLALEFVDFLISRTKKRGAPRKPRRAAPARR